MASTSPFRPLLSAIWSGLFQPLIDWAAPRLLTNFLAATGKSSNLRKALNIAKFSSSYNALTGLERE
jgi:hypothetical protein